MLASMSMRCLTPASLGILSFNVGPLCTGQITTLLRLAGSEHSHNSPLAFETRTKLLQHSGTSPKPWGTVIYCFVVILLFTKWLYSAYARGAWYRWWNSFTWNLNVLSKHPIPVKASLKALGILHFINQLALLSASLSILDLK